MSLFDFRPLRLAAIALAGVLTISGAAHAETFRLAHHHAVGGAADLVANHFAEVVKDKSDGRIQIQVFPGAQLGQEREAYDLVNQGAIDISITSTSILDKVYPPMAVTSLPFIFRGWDHAMHAYNGEFGATLTKNVREASNTQVLAYFGLGFRDMLFREDPITDATKMNGVKMRSPENFVFIRMFELLGARPTPVTWGEVYTAMQTGVAAGLDSPPASALDMKFQEVTHSIVKTGHMFGAMLLAMNKQKFDALSAEDQALIIEAAKETSDWNTTEVSIPAEKSAYDKLTAAGVVVAEPDDIDAWRTAMAPLLDEIKGRNDGSAEIIDLLIKTE